MRESFSRWGMLRHSRISLALLALLVFSSTLFTSCKKEYFELDRVKDGEWDPNLAIPLINSTLEVPDILGRFDPESEVVVIDSEGLLALRYFSEVFSINAAQLMALPNQNVTAPIALTAGQITTVESSGSFNMQQTVPVTFGVPNSETFTTINFKSGTIDQDFNSTIPYDITVVMSIPALTQGGSPYSRTVNIPASGSQSVSDPLAGYSLDLTQTANANEFEVDLDITFTDGPGTAVPTDQLVIDMGMNGIEFSSIFGDFGTQNVTTGLDSVRIKIFDNTSNGTIWWEDPKIRAYFTNTYGAALQVDINTLEAYNAQTGNTPINGFPSTLTIPAAPSPGQAGLHTDSVTTNTPGTNIQTVAANRPYYFFYDVDATANPGVGPFNNFALDSSVLKLEMEVELPFWGTATDFTKTDTAAFDLADMLGQADSTNTGGFLQPGDIEWIKIRLILDNGFPTEGWGQVYFADSNDVVVDSLLANPLDYVMSSGQLDGSGRVIEPTRNITDIILDRARLEAMRDAGVSQIISKGVTETTDFGTVTVKVFEEYTLGIRVSMQVQLKKSFGI